jgi:uncharacterized protein (TIGR00730 family)
MAQALGATLARRHVGLVFGGGNVGLMGVLADAVLAGGGEAIGVIPAALVAREIAHAGVTEMFVTEGMHPRKAKMAELSNAFIALPGGFGTYEELFEVVTWGQLGFHQKPIGLLDVEGYFGPLLALIDRAVADGFVQPAQARTFVHEEDPDALLDALAAWTPPPATRWIGPGQT